MTISNFKGQQIMRRISLVIVIIGLTYSIKAQYQTHSDKIGSDYFLNPVFAGDYPDPSIIKDGDNYYMVNSSFDYYPGLLIWQSKDLINKNFIRKVEKLEIIYFCYPLIHSLNEGHIKICN